MENTLYLFHLHVGRVVYVDPEASVSVIFDGWQDISKVFCMYSGRQGRRIKDISKFRLNGGRCHEAFSVLAIDMCVNTYVHHVGTCRVTHNGSIGGNLASAWLHFFLLSLFCCESWPLCM